MPRRNLLPPLKREANERTQDWTGDAETDVRTPINPSVVSPPNIPKLTQGVTVVQEVDSAASQLTFEADSVTGAARLLIGQGDAVVEVQLTKHAKDTMLGLRLWSDLTNRAIVHEVTPFSAAAELQVERPKLGPFDELLSVNGIPCLSAIHAVEILRGADAGIIVLRKHECPVRLHGAARVLQRGWRGSPAYSLKAARFRHVLSTLPLRGAPG